MQLPPKMWISLFVRKHQCVKELKCVRHLQNRKRLFRLNLSRLLFWRFGRQEWTIHLVIIPLSLAPDFFVQFSYSIIDTLKNQITHLKNGNFLPVPSAFSHKDPSENSFRSLFRETLRFLGIFKSSCKRSIRGRFIILLVLHIFLSGFARKKIK